MAVPKAAPKAAPESYLKIGAIVSIVSGGRTLEGYEVLGKDEHFVKFRGNIHVAPQKEIVLIPYEKIEAIGLERE